MNVARHTLPAVLGLLLSAAVFQASPARAADDTYAAIAYSESTGKYGYGYGYGSRAEAEEKAIHECKANDAKAIIWVYNCWCALALGDNGAWGCAKGETASIARAHALDQCRKYGEHPHVVVCVSSDGELQK